MAPSGNKDLTKPAFASWKLTIEILEKGVKVKNTAVGVVLMSLLLILNIFHTLF